MSATRDPSQKIAFVYSNLHQIFADDRQGVSSLPGSGVVIKAGQSTADQTPSPNRAPVGPPPAPRRVRPYSPAELIGKRLPVQERHLPAQLLGKRVARPESISRPSLESLKQNLKSLNELHARLKFMLAELEELTRD